MKKIVLHSFLITFKKCYKIKTAVWFLSGLMLSLLLNSTINAQSTIVKLPTTDSTSSFNITQSNDTNILRMFGDGGFYLGGTLSSGSVPVEGSGVRLMWYPGKSAFRVGYTDGSQWNDGNTGYYSTAIGYNTTATTDNSIAIGYNTTASGTYSTAMGSYVSTNNYTGSFIVGDVSTTTLANSSDINQMTMRFNGGYRLFTNGALTTGVTMGNGANSWSTISDSTKKFAFLPIDGKSVLEKISKFNLRTWSYKGQDPKTFRHYGPMAQEFFNAFGHDKYGVIGNDTTISQADFEGVLLVAVQALEKDNNELKDKVTQLQKEVDELNKMKAEFTEFKNDISSFINKGKITKKELTLNNALR